MWFDGAARPIRRYSTLTGKHQSSVAIVGGGMTGALVAQASASAGITTVLFSLPSTPARRFLNGLVCEPLGDRDRRALGLSNVMVWDTERPYHYARWTPEHRLLVGAATAASAPACDAGSSSEEP